MNDSIQKTSIDLSSAYLPENCKKCIHRRIFIAVGQTDVLHLCSAAPHLENSFGPFWLEITGELDSTDCLYFQEGEPSLDGNKVGGF